MRNIAWAMAILVFLSFLIIPMIEILNVTREKIALNTALTNAIRVAKDRSLSFEKQRKLDAEIEQNKFVQYFSEAFGTAMKITAKPISGNVLEFTSNNAQYNDFTVTLYFDIYNDSTTEALVTKVEVKAEADYKFKTKYLQMTNDAGKDVGFKLTGESTHIISVKN